MQVVRSLHLALSIHELKWWLCVIDALSVSILLIAHCYPRVWPLNVIERLLQNVCQREVWFHDKLPQIESLINMATITKALKAGMQSPFWHSSAPWSLIWSALIVLARTTLLWTAEYASSSGATAVKRVEKLHWTLASKDVLTNAVGSSIPCLRGMVRTF